MMVIIKCYLIVRMLACNIILTPITGKKEKIWFSFEKVTRDYRENTVHLQHKAVTLKMEGCKQIQRLAHSKAVMTIDGCHLCQSHLCQFGVIIHLHQFPAVWLAS